LRRQDAVTPEQLNKLKLYAQWSAAAYCMGDKPANQPVTCNLDQCSMFASHNAIAVASFTGNVTDIRGFIGVDPVDQQIVVSFRGSVSVRNWITDFIFLQVPCDLTLGCLVHSGFDISWAEVADSVLAGVSAAKAAHPTYKVAVTGHSLGGAVATVAAAYIRKAGFAADLYTYGSPRVGNRPFVDFVTEQPGAEYRVTHADDPVPRLPPILLNYRHTSPEYWIDLNDTDVANLDDVEYCPGYLNVQCNGGTKGLDMDAHGWYFQSLNGCSDGTTPFKRNDMSDADLEAKLNSYVDSDIELAKYLLANGES